MKTLEELKAHLENINFEISYNDWLELVNNLNKEELNNLEDIGAIISDDLAEKLDTNDIEDLRNIIQKLWENLKYQYKLEVDYTDYTYQPNEDGGFFTESVCVDGFDFGILGVFLDLECYASLRIDFRPNIGAYFEVTPLIREGRNHTGLLGEYKYLHYEIDLKSLDINAPTVQSY